jgi:hypothetical protein
MHTITWFRAEPALGKFVEATAAMSAGVRIIRRYSSDVTLWQTVVGGEGSSTLHGVVGYESARAWAHAREQLMVDADYAAQIAEMRASGPPYARQLQVFGGAVPATVEPVMLQRSAGSTPRAMLVETFPMSPASMELVPDFSALAAKMSAALRVTAFTVAGPRPAWISMGFVFDSMDALGAALDDHAGSDPSLSARAAALRMGMAINREILVN